MTPETTTPVDSPFAEIDAGLQSYSHTWQVFHGQKKLIVSASDLYNVMGQLKTAFGFSMLVDVTAVDFLEYAGAKDRFEVVYQLLDVEIGTRLTVSVFLNEPSLTLPSMYPLWTSADWMERETYDMYGIVFEGHPNFKRLLLPEEFTSFPLRKDYPVQGRGERHNFPVLTRAES